MLANIVSPPTERLGNQEDEHCLEALFYLIFPLAFIFKFHVKDKLWDVAGVGV